MNRSIVFCTLGDFRAEPLENLMEQRLVDIIKDELKADTKKPKKVLTYIEIGIEDDCLLITCILQSKKKKLREGKEYAYIYNVDKPELSKFTDIYIKKSWNGRFVRDEDKEHKD